MVRLRDDVVHVSSGSALTIALLGIVASSVPTLLLSTTLLTGVASYTYWALDILEVSLVLFIMAYAFSRNDDHPGFILHLLGDQQRSVWLRIHRFFVIVSLLDLFIIALAISFAFGAWAHIPLIIENIAPVATVFSLVYSFSLVGRSIFLNALGMDFRTFIGDSPIGTSALASVSEALLQKGNKRGLPYLEKALSVAASSYRRDRLRSKSFESALVTARVFSDASGSMDADDFAAASRLAKAATKLPDARPFIDAMSRFEMKYDWSHDFELMPEPPKTRYEFYAVAAALLAAAGGLASYFLSSGTKQNILAFLSSALAAETIISAVAIYAAYRSLKGMLDYFVSRSDINAMSRFQPEPD